jgi:ubiquinone/menaquinone biosynthesis C-methylase UbiE
MHELETTDRRWIAPDERTTSKWIDDRERTDRMLARFGERLLDLASLQPGERVLDIGCGTGATSVAAWERVAPNGSVTGVDISPPMLEAAHARACSLTNAHIAWVAADAQTFAFAPHACDVALSRFGVAHFIDTLAAFRNIRGALRNSGRFVFTEWTSRATNEWMSLVDDVARRSLPELAEPHHRPQVHSSEFADERTLRSLLAGTGFRMEHFEAHSDRLSVGRTPDDVLAWFARLPEGRVLEALTPEARTRFTDALRIELERRTDATGVYLAGSAWMVCCRASE